VTTEHVVATVNFDHCGGFDLFAPGVDVAFDFCVGWVELVDSKTVLTLRLESVEGSEADL